MFNLPFSKHILAQQKINIKWAVIGQLPKQPGKSENIGVAGAFSGRHGNVLIIAGGANFPEGMPWNGGTKVFHDEIYVLGRDNKGGFHWLDSGVSRLPVKMAYGACLSTRWGVLCVGGQNSEDFLRNAFLLQWDEHESKIKIKWVPEIPVPLANAAISVIGDIVYLAGGESFNSVTKEFYSLDLRNLSAGWTVLPPLPEPVSHAISVAQYNGRTKCIYVIGGRRKRSNGISDLYDSVFEFDPITGKWTAKKPLPYPLSAGSGMAFDSDRILLFGGDKGTTFHETELLLAAIANEQNSKEKENLVRMKNDLQQSHPGFSNTILSYSCDLNRWTEIGEIPFPVPVTTSTVKWDDRIIIPGGEVKAGVRTSNVLMGIICKAGS